MSKKKFIEKFKEALSEDTLEHLTKHYSIPDFDAQETEYVIGISSRSLYIQDFKGHLNKAEGIPLYHIKFGEQVKVSSVWKDSSFPYPKGNLPQAYHKETCEKGFTAEHIKFHTHTAHESMFASGNICRG